MQDLSKSISLAVGRKTHESLQGAAYESDGYLKSSLTKPSSGLCEVANCQGEIINSPFVQKQLAAEFLEVVILSKKAIPMSKEATEVIK
ncbi:hypothetical protein CEXT_4601 [Caerostris extrusa]|uniref:Uncharacterized protein n=1 Tax=Caerostris extrusa TaxID=172846 RepID=A0AAV4TZN0_CAEEX|nr:hypothetical protein CEXT_4601 [Caerostris extrusa]